MDLSKIPGRGGKGVEGLPEGVGKSSEVPPPPGWVAPWQERKGPYEADGFAGVALLAGGLLLVMTNGKMLAGIALWMWHMDSSSASRMWAKAGMGGPEDMVLLVDVVLTLLGIGLALWALAVGVLPNSSSAAGAAGGMLGGVAAVSAGVLLLGVWQTPGAVAVFWLPAGVGTAGMLVLLRRYKRLSRWDAGEV